MFSVFQCLNAGANVVRTWSSTMYARDEFPVFPRMRPVSHFTFAFFVGF